ncbi:hypothetical protein BN2475_1300002 [Paraburkholderia ribeironis]|uniref:Uncharacterized protein n=1 Tax=Paraburkholderia ribeironis TaxID=1247936 RepID=A0A1N7SP79_9BURK|nr:hypothetical protein BN2475_1300002 [Paraburkholderia ribeironis]
MLDDALENTDESVKALLKYRRNSGSAGHLEHDGLESSASCRGCLHAGTAGDEDFHQSGEDR